MGKSRQRRRGAVARRQPARARKAAFMAKVDEEVSAGRARWVRLRWDQLLTPRFVVDEGWKQTVEGQWKRKAMAHPAAGASPVACRRRSGASMT